MLACFKAAAAAAVEAAAAEAVVVAAARCIGSVLEYLGVLEPTPGPADAARMLSLSGQTPCAGSWAWSVAVWASAAGVRTT